ncbi:MAG: hypothetical protein ACI4PR_02620 [Acutalibacteraceae bacterium]
MENKNEKVLDKGLEKVAGGYVISHDCQSKNTSIQLTQEEYNCLVDGGFIGENGRCSVDRWCKISNYLKEKGYKGHSCIVGGDLPCHFENGRWVDEKPKIDPASIDPYIEFIISE